MVLSASSRWSAASPHRPRSMASTASSAWLRMKVLTLPSWAAAAAAAVNRRVAWSVSARSSCASAARAGPPHARRSRAAPASPRSSHRSPSAPDRRDTSALPTWPGGLERRGTVHRLEVEGRGVHESRPPLRLEVSPGQRREPPGEDRERRVAPRIAERPRSPATVPRSAAGRLGRSAGAAARPAWTHRSRSDVFIKCSRASDGDPLDSYQSAARRCSCSMISGSTRRSSPRGTHGTGRGSGTSRGVGRAGPGTGSSPPTRQAAPGHLAPRGSHRTAAAQT